MARLLLRDTVGVKIGGGYDSDGRPIPSTTATVRAELVPLSGSEQALRGRNTTLTTYRLVVTDKRIETATSVIWRGVTYVLEGKAMPYRIRGITHHYEVVISSAAG